MLCCLSNPLPDIGVNFFSGTAVTAAFLLPAFFCHLFLPFLCFLLNRQRLFSSFLLLLRLYVSFHLEFLSFLSYNLPFLLCLLISQSAHINLFKEFSEMLGINPVRSQAENTRYPDKMSSAFPYSLFFRI